MGTYLPTNRRRKRSVSDTLLEAEQEHYLDCPNADVPIRTAALLLDLILFSLASSGIHHLIQTMRTLVPPVLGLETPTIYLGISYLSWMLKTLVLFLYFVWTVMRFGGSPAKLIMGLRVVDAESGDRLDYQRTLLRETVGKIFGTVTLAGPLAALFRSDKRALHDLLSGSTVKKVRGGP